MFQIIKACHNSGVHLILINKERERKGEEKKRWDGMAWNGISHHENEKPTEIGRKRETKTN